MDITGTATTDAAAIVYGGVDAVTLQHAPHTGYLFPTVDFDQPDGPDGVKATGHAVYTTATDGTFTVTGILVDSPGSGYSYAPNAVLRDGTFFDPILGSGELVTATTTLSIQNIVLTNFGAGYSAVPDVAIADSNGGSGSGAIATASIDIGAVTEITLNSGGSGYLMGGIKKFQDSLSMLCDPSVCRRCVANNMGQYLPLAVPDTTTFTTA